MSRQKQAKRKDTAGSPPSGEISVRYELRYEEAYEALRLIVDRRSRRSRQIMGYMLLALAVVCVALYAHDPYGLQFALLAILLAVFSFLVLWTPHFKAQKGARAITRRKGYYQYTLSGEGYILLTNGTKIDLKGDKDCRAHETETLFAIRPDRINTFSLPKRCLTESEILLTREILDYYVRVFYTSHSGQGTAPVKP
ncbi:MAG: hypothetical protein LUD78_10140 [Clostridiales bacterium]|nr:hypothetical protein [Clostridiales bacterium]